MSDYIDEYTNYLISEPVSKKLKSIINTRSVVCGLVLMLPTPALDEIIYAILLWSMYGKLAKEAGVPFRNHFIKNVIGGFIVNIIVVIILDSIGDILSTFAIGFVLSFIVGVAFTKLSGHMFVNQLKIFHGDKVSNNPNVRVESEQTYNQQQFSSNNNIQSLPETSQYYLVINNKQNGPLNLQQLQQMAANGQLSDSMLVWKEGMANWAAISTVTELRNLFNNGYFQNAVPPPHYNTVPPAYNPPAQIQAPRSNNLLTCPDCGQMVSSRADACPNCGCPISEMNQ